MISIGAARSVAWLTLATLFPSLEAAADNAEDELKAAVVLTFLRYGEWGAAPSNAPILVGVLGRPAMAEVLRRTVEGKAVNGRPLQVVALKNAAEPRCCELVYFADDKTLDSKAALESPAFAHVLTIGENRDFLDWGGDVNLFVLDGRMSFEVSLDALERSGISISSKLLRFGQVRSRKKGERL